MLIAFLCVAATAFCRTYTVDAKRSKIEIRQKNKQGQTERFHFTQFGGSIEFEPYDMKISRFALEVKSQSLTSGDADALKALKGLSGLACNEYPLISLRSDSLYNDLSGSVVYQMVCSIKIKNFILRKKIQFTASTYGGLFVLRSDFTIPSGYFQMYTSGAADQTIEFFLELNAR